VDVKQMVSEESKNQGVTQESQESQESQVSQVSQ
jgi:hypothetical protein